MDPRQLPVDSRLVGQCVFCGGEPGTSDHVPSNILLDDPLPGDLPTVEACALCNGSFSVDEEYLACLLECVLCGTTEAAAVGREKVARALAHNPSLGERVRGSLRKSGDGLLVWMPEEDRVRRIVVKLARGHAAYELSLPQIEEPIGVSALPLIAMHDSDRTTFENAGAGSLRGWPEIGSRAFHRAAGAHPYAAQPGPWINVQEGRYRYSVDQDGGVSVRFVLSEYLACTVEWE
jgi:hypothetical protein